MRRLKSNSGVTITEAMVGVAVVAATALGIGMALQQASKGSRSVSGGLSCHSTAKSVMDKIASMGRRTNVLLPVIVDSTTMDGTFLNPVVNQFYQNQAQLTNSNWFTTNPAALNYPKLVEQVPDLLGPGQDGFRLNNSMLILGSLGALQSLYNQDVSSYCADVNGVSIRDRVFPNQTDLPRNVTDIRLRVQPYDLVRDEVISPCPNPPLIAVPKREIAKPNAGGPWNSPANDPVAEGFEVGGYPDLAFFATVTVFVDDNNSQNISCEVTAKFEHQRDNKRPEIDRTQTNMNVTNGSGKSLNIGTSYTSCNTEAGFNTLNFSFDVSQLAEPGSVIMCQAGLVSPTGSETLGPWAPCGSAPFNDGGTLYPPTSGTLVGNTATITYDGLPCERGYKMLLKAVDSAGNESDPEPMFVGAGQDYVIIDCQRPSISGAATADPDVGSPGDGRNGRGSYASLFSWPVSEVQCNTQQVNLTATVSGTWPISFSGCTCSSNTPGVASCSGSGSTCQGVSQGTSHGEQDFTFTAQDVCGTGDSQTANWYTAIDFNPSMNSITTCTPHPVDLTQTISDNTYFQAYCDCNSSPTAGAFGSITCTQNSGALGGIGDGCEGGVHNASVSDICGRQQNISSTYNVQGGVGQGCDKAYCCGGNVCSVGNAGPHSLLTCSGPVSTLPDCSERACGAYGPANGCPDYWAVLDCSSSPTCYGNHNGSGPGDYSVVSGCNCGDSNGDPCTFENENDPSDLNNDGDREPFNDSGTCTNTNSSCTTKASIGNPPARICPVRGPNCPAGPLPPPPPGPVPTPPLPPVTITATCGTTCSQAGCGSLGCGSTPPVTSGPTMPAGNDGQCGLGGSTGLGGSSTIQPTDCDCTVSAGTLFMADINCDGLFDAQDMTTNINIGGNTLADLEQLPDPGPGTCSGTIANSGSNSCCGVGMGLLVNCLNEALTADPNACNNPVQYCNNTDTTTNWTDPNGNAPGGNICVDACSYVP